MAAVLRQTTQKRVQLSAVSPITCLCLDILYVYNVELFKTKTKKGISVSLLTQNQIHSNHLRRGEQESRSLQERVQTLTVQNKDLHVQLQEIKRRQAEIECKVHVRVCCWSETHNTVNTGENHCSWLEK